MSKKESEIFEPKEILHFSCDKKNYFELLNQAFIDAKETFDFTLIIEEKKVYCHKGVLSVKSEYFREIFKKNKNIECATFKNDVGLSLATTKKIIQYIYGIEINLPQEIDQALIDFMRHLYFFKVKDLKLAIAKNCITAISHENVCLLYKAAYLYDEQELKENCYEYVLQYASKIFVKSNKTVNLHEIPYYEMIRLVQDDYLDIDEKDLIESLISWINKNVTQQVGDQEENGVTLGQMLWTDKKVNEYPFNDIIRYARMEHPEINDLFEKNEYLRKIMVETERTKVSSEVYRLILERQQYFKDGGKGILNENENQYSKPRTEAVFKFTQTNYERINFENAETDKPVEIRDYGYRIKRTDVKAGYPILIASDRNMMTKAAFKIKILKGGYKSKSEEPDITSDKTNVGFIGIGLIESNVLEEFPSKFQDIKGKFVALYNSKGHVHLAWSNKKKMEISSMTEEINNLKKELALIESTSLKGEENPELDELNRKVQSLEEHRNHLMMEPNITSKGYDKDGLKEGHVITVYINNKKQQVSFYINKHQIFTNVDISHLGKNLMMAVWLANPGDSVVMVEAKKISSLLVPFKKYKDLNSSDYIVGDENYMNCDGLFDADK